MRTVPHVWIDFSNPEWLWLLAIVPVLTVCAGIGQARRRRDWTALGQAGRPPGDGSIGWVLAAACLVVALAQPRWGRPGRLPLPPGRDVVLALDVSRSMGCEDVVPNRLGRAIEAAVGLVRALGAGDRAAVVAFAGRGVLRCPLTQSLGAVADTLRSLRPSELRPGGTDLASALDAAAEAFDDQDHSGGRTVVLVSDGEDHPAVWPAALDRLRHRDANMTVHTVAIGDAERGHPVPVRSRSASPSEPLRYQGLDVSSRRDDTALEAIAKATGGAFVPLGTAETDLGRLYRARIEPVAQARRAGLRGGATAERYGVFVLAALGLGLVACRPVWRRPTLGRVGVSLAAVAVVAVAAAGPAPPGGESPERLVVAGRAAYEEGKFREALDAFTRAARSAPGDAVPRYDVAAATFQLGLYREALDAYQAARERAGVVLRAKIDFALGNTAVALGDLDAAIAHYDRCLASGARGPVVDEVRRRAAANRKFVEEQARHAPRPPDTSPSASGPSDRSNSGDQPGGQPSARGASAEGGAGAGEAPAPNRRGTGGAGGSGPAPPLPGSAEDRLERALDNIREALHQRLEDALPVEDSRDHKDW
jgi:Ca-activated chloride channel homolog